ncbi:MAG: UDP-glucose/GDP-mannose dehydrogenase family protein [Gemmatimonadota bacterium]|nr:MAG: UDP-glucose/GDP-mannose dehydrogenase family protein [Gemmatimonadota bacterium]
MRKICMIGTGYVGLVTGACFADFGNSVLCVDVDSEKIELLKNSVVPFFEPGLKEFIERNTARQRLGFSDDVEWGIRESEVIFIAVGTPSLPDGSADLSQVFSVSEKIAENMTEYKVVVNKSTVSVGTGAKVADVVRTHQKKPIPFDVVSNPEFLREGSALEDFMRPDRVVIGATSDRALDIMSEIYRPLYLIETPIIKTNLETAELIKYASNAYLATRISFINEVANLCEKVGADVNVVAKAMGLDGRIGPKFLHAGAGFGGSCFPKDTRALIKIAEQAGSQISIVEAAIAVNQNQREVVFQKIQKMNESLEGKCIGFLGLSFKPKTDDMREAPSITVIEKLIQHKATIKAYDPVAQENAKKVLKDIEYCQDPYSVAEHTDTLVVMTEWNEFRELDFPRIKEVMNVPKIVDARNVYDPEKMRELGFEYAGIGR